MVIIYHHGVGVSSFNTIMFASNLKLPRIIGIAMKVFGERLRELRKTLGISQKELADRLEIGQSSVAAYENGTKTPTAPVVAKVARFFNVSADYLLGLTDDPSPKGDGLSPVIRQKLERLEKLERKYEELRAFMSRFFEE